MPTTSTPTTLLTARDLEILAALDRCPLTAAQLLKLSQAFGQPFTHERRVRERMQALCAASRVRRWLYATAGRGALGYYTLSRLGHQILHGEKEVAAAKRSFGPVGIARQFHTICLADFIVHTALAAHRTGLAFTGFYRENTFRLRVGDEHLYPDGAFQLIAPTQQEYSFFVEVDNSSQRIRSTDDLDNWHRKIRLYDAFQDRTPKRFRVLVVATRSDERLAHILQTAASVMRNPARSLLYGISLSEYLACGDALTAPCFRDHRGRRVALVLHGPRPVGATANRKTLVPR